MNDNEKQKVDPNSQINTITKQFYVYELYDAVSGDVFYVGEGIRDRAFQHIKEADRIREQILNDPSLDGTLGSDKISRIQQLQADGSDRLGVRVIGRFDSKEAAQAVETVLINWVYGQNSLTNISRGHGADYVRPKTRPTDDLAGIDIDKRIRIFGGGAMKNTGYLEEKIKNHEIYGHLAMAEEIVEFLRNRFPNMSIDDPCYWESGRYIGVFVNLVDGKVRMIIQLTDSGKNQHVYNLKPMSEAQEDVDKFVEYMTENHEDIPLKKSGRYSKLPFWENMQVKNDDHETIALHVQKAIDFFAGSR